MKSLSRHIVGVSSIILLFFAMGAYVLEVPLRELVTCIIPLSPEEEAKPHVCFDDFDFSFTTVFDQRYEDSIGGYSLMIGSNWEVSDYYDMVASEISGSLDLSLLSVSAFISTTYDSFYAVVFNGSLGELIAPLKEQLFVLEGEERQVEFSNVSFSIFKGSFAGNAYDGYVRDFYFYSSGGRLFLFFAEDPYLQDDLESMISSITVLDSFGGLRPSIEPSVYESLYEDYDDYDYQVGVPDVIDKRFEDAIGGYAITVGRGWETYDWHGEAFSDFSGSLKDSLLSVYEIGGSGVGGFHVFVFNGNVSSVLLPFKKYVARLRGVGKKMNFKDNIFTVYDGFVVNKRGELSEYLESFYFYSSGNRVFVFLPEDVTSMSLFEDVLGSFEVLPLQAPLTSDGSAKYLEVAVTDGPFVDVIGHPHLKAILYAEQQGLLSVSNEGKFRPNESINRAELMKLLVMDLPSMTEKLLLDSFSAKHLTRYGVQDNFFTDVALDSWYAPYVSFAADLGWVSGYSDGTFRPSALLSWSEALKIIGTSRGFGSEPWNGALHGAWYDPYLEVYEKSLILHSINEFTYGIIGFSDSFGLSDSITRAQVAELLYRHDILALDDGQL